MKIEKVPFIVCNPSNVAFVGALWAHRMRYTAPPYHPRRVLRAVIAAMLWWATLYACYEWVLRVPWQLAPSRRVVAAAVG